MAYFPARGCAFAIFCNFCDPLMTKNSIYKLLFARQRKGAHGGAYDGYFVKSPLSGATAQGIVYPA